MLTTMGEEVMTDAEVDELLAEVDVDGSGVIDMDEFKNMPCWIPPQALQSRRARHNALLSGREPGALGSGGESCEEPSLQSVRRLSRPPASPGLTPMPYCRGQTLACWLADARVARACSVLRCCADDWR